MLDGDVGPFENLDRRSGEHNGAADRVNDMVRYAVPSGD